MKVKKNILQVTMARQCINPYELCEKAGVRYPVYRSLANGGNCRPATVGKIARALGVDVTELLEPIN